MDAAVLALTCIVSLASAVASEEASLRLSTLHTVGLEEDGVFINKPVGVVALGDETVVLGQGDAEVVIFDRDWSVRRRFGAAGEGPGLLLNPHDVAVVREEIWILEDGYISLFSVDGRLTKKVATKDRYRSFAVSGDTVLAVSGHSHSERPVFALITRETIASPVRREIGVSVEVSEFARAVSWRVAQRGESGWFLHNLYSGEGYVVSGLEGTRTVALGLEAGNSRKSNALYWDLAMNAACWHPDAGYIVAKNVEAEEGALVATLYARRGESPLVRIEHSLTDIAVSRMEVLATGELCILDPWSSILVACEFSQGVVSENSNVLPHGHLETA